MCEEDRGRAFVEPVHQLLRPMTPYPAPRAEGRTVPVGRALLDVHGIGPCRLRLPANLVGLPVLALPVESSEGLPVGGQLDGPAWSLSGLLAVGRTYQVGRAYHDVTDWHLPRPHRRPSTTAPALATASDARCGR